MTEKEYLKELKSNLSALKRSDRNSLIEFYKEMIEDKIENGKTEQEAVLELEPAEVVAKRTLAEYGIDEEELNRQKKINGTTLALLIIGSPLWIPIAIAAFAIVLAVAISAIAVVISLLATCVGITLCAPVVFVMGIITAFSDLGTGLIAIGSGLSAAALGILASTGFYKLSVYIVKKIKKIITKGAKL